MVTQWAAHQSHHKMALLSTVWLYTPTLCIMGVIVYRKLRVY